LGHKVNPISFRIGYIKNWRSLWFARKKEFANFLIEDVKICDYVKKNYSQAAIADVRIERSANRLRVIIHSARPGVIIGRRGADIDRLRDELQELASGKEIFIDIKEVKNPETNAQLIADNIAFQITKRIAYRRAMKKAVQQAMNGGAQGIKVQCGGRLAGAEMCRTEKYREGKIPLQTKRADIDYGFSVAHTTYGCIGVKAWVYKGDIIVAKGQAKAGENQTQNSLPANT
jgi:small subunit ribosomal protein S3